MVKLVDRDPDQFVDCGNCGSRLSYKFREPKRRYYGGDGSWYSYIGCVVCNNSVVVDNLSIDR